MADSKEEALQVWTDGHDTYVVRDKDHLRAVYEEHYGESMEYVTGDDDAIQHWHKVPPEKEIVIRLHEINVRGTLDIPEDGELLGPIRVEATAESWAKHNGPGLLCTESA